MTHCNSVNVKLSDSPVDKLKSVTKSETVVTLSLSSNMIDYDENNFVDKVLPNNKQIPSLHKAFAYNFLTNIKISKI